MKRDPKKGIVNNQILDWSFKLDGIFHNATQEHVFSTVASNLVTSAIDGYNGKYLHPILTSDIWLNLMKVEIFVHGISFTYESPLGMEYGFRKEVCSASHRSNTFHQNKQ